MKVIKFIVGGIVFIMILGMCTNSKTKEPISPASASKDIVKICTKEAGLSAEADPNHRVTPAELNIVESCIEREKAKFR